MAFQDTGAHADELYQQRQRKKQLQKSNTVRKKDGMPPTRAVSRTNMAGAPITPRAITSPPVNVRIIAASPNPAGVFSVYFPGKSGGFEKTMAKPPPGQTDITLESFLLLPCRKRG